MLGFDTSIFTQMNIKPTVTGKREKDFSCEKWHDFIITAKYSNNFMYTIVELIDSYHECKGHLISISHRNVAPQKDCMKNIDFLINIER